MEFRFPSSAPQKTIGILITRFAEYGGAQVHVRDLAICAQERGARVVIIAGTLGTAAQDARNIGLEVIEASRLVREISPMNDIMAVKQISKMIKNHNIDLLHCHSSKAGIVGRLAAKLAGVPAVFTAHGWAFTEGVSPKKRKLYAAIERSLAPLARKIITVSEYDKNLALGSRVGDKNRLIAIQNGMPFLPAVERKVRAPGETLKLIMVARIATPKDQSQLIEGLSLIKDQSWELSIVGGGEDDHLRALALESGVSDKIFFLGERSDVPDLLAQHDVFCLISNWEGFPLTIVEAMRSNMPVIASNVGGCPEAVQDEKTGFLVSRQDPENIAAAVMKYLSDPGLVLEHGNEGRARFEEHFTFDAMADKTFATYGIE
jgi:glycosyltransferase involved in cell wall biosynthesis